MLNNMMKPPRDRTVVQVDGPKWLGIHIGLFGSKCNGRFPENTFIPSRHVDKKKIKPDYDDSCLSMLKMLKIRTGI